MDELSKKSTAAACSQFKCDDCEIQGKLLCIHKPADLIDFYVLFMGWAIPFFSGMIIGKFWAGIIVLIVAGWTMQRTQCNRCYNLSCPINRVPDDVKDFFFKHYPEFCKAWEITESDRT